MANIQDGSVAFFETMNGIDGAKGKNPFSVSPYCRQRRYDAKYIPESVAVQLDTAFKNDEIALYLRCVYWLLRLIPASFSPSASAPRIPTP